MGERATQAIRDWHRMDDERGTFKTHWQDVANYGFPDRSDYITTKTPGQKRMSYVYDSTPLMALDQFAAGMHSRLTSSSSQWFYMLTEDDRINIGDDARSWLEDAGAAMYRLFNSPRHNFASQSYELYMDEGSIGTAVMAVLDSARSSVLFSTRHLKECCIALNEEDRVDVLMRNWPWTAKQAVDQWTLDGLKRAGAEKVLKAYADNDTSPKFNFIHDVRPRRKRNPDRGDALHMAFESVYIGVQDSCEISVGGFPEFPYLVPRFSKLTGETYGRGPMMLALPDIKMLNELTKLVVKSAQKIIDPPLQVPDDGFLVPVRTVPGALNYYRATSQNTIKPIETHGQVQLGIELINALRQQILKAMYVEWMIMPSDPKDPASTGKGVTATYVLQQRDDKMLFLAPMLARLQAEFLGPLIDRVFAILWRQSKARRFNQDPANGPVAPFRLPPPSLSGVPLRVEYVSPIAVAQKAAQMDGVTRLMQLQAQMRQMDPQGALFIDPEFIMRLAQRDWNAPAGTVKSPERLQQEDQQRADAAKALAGHQQMEQMAGAAADGSKAVKQLAEARSIAQDGGDQERQAA